MKLIITTVKNPTFELTGRAKQAAQELNAPYIVRGEAALQKLVRDYAVGAALVFSRKGPAIVTAEGEYAFHLNMAQLRLQNIKRGQTDHLVEALALQQGSSVLDCTIGLAADAIVASYVTGASGQVVGLEASPVLAFIVASGLQSFNARQPAVTAALRRITVQNADYNDYLAALPANSVDVVYFDPMFRHPINSSSNFIPVRMLTDRRPVSQEAWAEACRVARHRVVFKETNGSPEFDRLGIKTYCGGRYSAIQYGIVEVDS